MNFEELKELAFAKIEKALSKELPAEQTAMYIQALASFQNEKQEKLESEKV